MKTKRIIGMIIGITAMVLAIVWYDWKLALVIFLALTGNNFGQSKNGEEE